MPVGIVYRTGRFTEKCQYYAAGGDARCKTGLLSKNQVETVAKLRKNLANDRSIELATVDMHPILVGKNVVFGRDWMLAIGNGRPFTPQLFAVWRNHADLTYDSYVDLTGNHPRHGEKILIDFEPHSQERYTRMGRRGIIGALANNSYLVTFNRSMLLPKVTAKDLTLDSRGSLVMQHEIAHLFCSGRPWEHDAFDETITELFVAYHQERMGGGRSYRTQRMKAAQRYINYGRRSISESDFYLMNQSDQGAAYSFYLFGLVEKAGWNAYKRAFRSYLEFEKTPYLGDEASATAREFFDRVAQAYGNLRILRSLPDSGRFLDWYFDAWPAASMAENDQTTEQTSTVPQNTTSAKPTPP